MKTHLLKYPIGFSVTAAAFILGGLSCLADTCPSDIEATPTGGQERLAHQYQPPDGDILQRYRFVPPPPYTAKYPTVLMLPPDEFYKEYGDRGVPSEQWATYDLQQAGLLVFQIDHRLASPGALTGQSSTSGHPPDQTDDVKRQILAALADPDCNGSIYIVAGSAGGCLALWCALDSATGAVSGWDNTARTHIKAVVALSGVTDPSNWSNPGGIDLTEFENAMDIYVNIPTPLTITLFCATLLQFS